MILGHVIFDTAEETNCPSTQPQTSVWWILNWTFLIWYLSLRVQVTFTVKFWCHISSQILFFLFMLALRKLLSSHSWFLKLAAEVGTFSECKLTEWKWAKQLFLTCVYVIRISESVLFSFRLDITLKHSHYPLKARISMH